MRHRRTLSEGACNRKAMCLTSFERYREIGRSERIRTSDPLLPKQVRYQAALRSDRGRGVKRFYRAWQADSRHSARRRSRRLMRGTSPASARDLVDKTGLFFDTRGVPSRITM